jgi:LacI family transcriptional regulator
VFTAEERALGYREALEEAGTLSNSDLVRHADFKVRGGHEAATSLLDTEQVDAVLVGNSMMTVGVLEVFRERGITPGRDIEVVAFDDARWTGLLVPSISVVRQPAYELGQVAGQLLLERLAEPDRPARTVMLNATLPTWTPGTGRTLLPSDPRAP